MLPRVPRPLLGARGCPRSRGRRLGSGALGEFAKRLLDDAALSDKERIERAYLMALTRPPEPDEIDAALTYIGNLEKQLGKPDSHLTAWQSLCQVLIATNEFLYLN
jgi:hypothetical protein